MPERGWCSDGAVERELAGHLRRRREAILRMQVVDDLQTQTQTTA